MTAPDPRGYRIGDLVEITGRHAGRASWPMISADPLAIGRTGVIAKIDSNPAYPISLTIKGFPEPVRCSPDEIRRLDAVEAAALPEGGGAAEAQDGPHGDAGGSEHASASNEASGALRGAQGGCGEASRIADMGHRFRIERDRLHDALSEVLATGGPDFDGGVLRDLKRTLWITPERLQGWRGVLASVERSERDDARPEATP